MARRLTFPEQQRFNPFRRPSWCWDRAQELIRTGQYYSRKRDDAATGIVVEYLREITQCRSELRLKRIKDRFRHLALAQDIWQSAGTRRLEIELRILARQNDTEIGLEMDIPAATSQAYRDIYFDIEDRIDSTSYILHRVIGIRPDHPPAPVQFAKACAYHHGPGIVAPLIVYLTQDNEAADLTSAAGRRTAAIDLLFRVHVLSDSEKTQRSLLKRLPFLVQNTSKFAKSVSAAAAFRKSTSEIMEELGFPYTRLAPISYAPPPKPSRQRRKQLQLSKAA